MGLLCAMIQRVDKEQDDATKTINFLERLMKLDRW